jgi:membrane protease YdiL (CAAX protease family)
MTGVPLRTATTPGEALAVVALCFGWFILASVSVVLAGFPANPQGFSDGSFLFTGTYELVFGALAIALLHRRGYDIASLVPRPSWRDSGVALLLVAAAWMAGVFAMALFASGQPEQPFVEMLRNARVSAFAVLLFAIVNGAFEEIFLLGFLMRGLEAHGLSISLGVMILVRVSYHLYQGPLGAMSMLGFGLVFGLYHSRTHRLWPPVLAHMICDVIPFLA